MAGMIPTDVMSYTDGKLRHHGTTMATLPSSNRCSPSTHVPPTHCTEDVYSIYQSLKIEFPLLTTPLSPPPDTVNVSMPSQQSKQLEEATEAAVKASVVTNPEVNTLQSEENVSISGSNARLMIMKKLSRKTDVSECVSVLPGQPHVQ